MFVKKFLELFIFVLIRTYNFLDLKKKSFCFSYPCFFILLLTWTSNFDIKGKPTRCVATSFALPLLFSSEFLCRGFLGDVSSDICQIFSINLSSFGVYTFFLKFSKMTGSDFFSVFLDLLSTHFKTWHLSCVCNSTSDETQIDSMKLKKSFWRPILKLYI